MNHLKSKGSSMIEIIISMFFVSIIILISSKIIIELNKSVKMRKETMYIEDIARAVQYEVNSMDKDKIKNCEIDINLDDNLFEKLKVQNLIDLQTNCVEENYIKIIGNEKGDNILVLLRYNNKICKYKIEKE